MAHVNYVNCMIRTQIFRRIIFPNSNRTREEHVCACLRQHRLPKKEKSKNITRIVYHTRRKSENNWKRCRLFSNQRRKKDPKRWIKFHFIFRFIFINHIQRCGCCRCSHFKKRNTVTRSAAPYAHKQAYVRAWNAYNRRCVCDDGCRQEQQCALAIFALKRSSQWYSNALPDTDIFVLVVLSFIRLRSPASHAKVNWRRQRW